MTSLFEVREHRWAEYALTPTQEELRSAAATLLAGICPTDRVRSAQATTGHDRDLQEAVGKHDLFGLAVTGTDDHGVGLLLDAVIVVEELAKVLAPIPFVESIVAARLLRSLGRPDGLVDDILAGRGSITIDFTPDEPRSQLPGGAQARHVLEVHPEHIDLVVRDAPDRLVLVSGVEATTAGVVALAEWRILWSASLAAAASRAIGLAIAFAAQRETRGVPIGSLQAISHPIVSSTIELEAARNMARKAAWYNDHEPDARRGLSQAALIYAMDSALVAVERAVHTHGGMGVCRETDVTLYFSWLHNGCAVAGRRARLLREIGAILATSTQGGSA